MALTSTTLRLEALAEDASLYGFQQILSRGTRHSDTRYADSNVDAGVDRWGRPRFYGPQWSVIDGSCDVPRVVSGG
ncbi:hypothetical protein [Haloarcula pelagica]|nr:hypothetical protein [Halomicroarcula sp. YJ-61-S]